MNRLIHFIQCAIVGLALSGCQNQQPRYTSINGTALGTTYRLVYQIPANAPASFSDSVTQQVNRCYTLINGSLSIYNNRSLLSAINRNETQNVDSLFTLVFNKSVEINKLTKGAFDIAAAPLFNAWGFGLGQRQHVTQETIDSLMLFTGMDKIVLHDGRIQKKDPRVTLNLNAIAKGFTSDYIGSTLEALGISHYLIEIGGEIACKGVNPSGGEWRVGIDRPSDGNLDPGKDLQAIVGLHNQALATSGNYRNYYIENGRKIAHTINPATGYPVTHSLLSVTVIAPDCMTADAYATAFMTMGKDATLSFLANHPELGVLLICDDFDENYTVITAGPIHLLKK